jgi:tetratricopeptide (TPR) repeat protein
MAKSFEAYRNYDKAKLEEALADATAALSMDANSVNALVTRAFCRWQQLQLGTASSFGEIWEDGVNAAMRAIAADRNDCRGYVQRAMLLALAPEKDPNNGALASARRAYELNPNDMIALQILAWVEALSGNTDSALEHLNQQMRISPRDPLRYGVYNQFAMTLFFAGRYAEGADCAALGIQEAPTHGTLHGWLALNYVGLGDLPEARTAFAEAQKLAPRWVERGLSGSFAFRDKEHHARARSFLGIAAGLES